MATFLYKAVKTDGRTTEGELEAGGRQDAFRQMETLGLRPIKLAERNGAGAKAPAFKPTSKAAPEKATATKTVPADKGASKEAASTSKAPAAPAKLSFSLGGGKKITPRILENFTRLLSSLLAAGVPLSRALVILQREAATPYAREEWKGVYDRVVDGMTLADAMAQSPTTFPRVYIAMVEAGETGGFLDVVLAQIADFQAREKEMKGKVLTALLYPIILLVLALGVLVFLMVFFIPRFKLIFAGFGAKLPLITEIIVGLSDLMRAYGLFVLAGIAIALYLVRTWFLSEKGRRVWEGFILRAPVIGPLASQFAMSRFCRMLGTLLGAGVPLINGLNVARRSIGNQVLVDAVSESIDQIGRASCRERVCLAV